MKILMVNDHRPEDVLGGTERYILDVTAALEERGHQVHLFAMSDSGSETTVSRYIFRVRAPNLVALNLKRTFFYPKLYRTLRGYVRELRPDVVHLHNNYRFAITVNLALRGQRVVQTVHDYTALYPTAFCARERSCAGRSPLVAWRHGCLNWKVLLAAGWLLYNRRFLDRRIVRRFIAPSRDLAGHLEKRGYRDVHHLPNFTSVPIAPDEPLPEKPVILYVGSLIAHKGVDVLLRAFSRVAREIPEATLWLVGSGPEEKRLRELVEEMGLSGVRFLGQHDHEGLARFYRAARVVVIPSLWLENAPLVAYEAMAHGRAIVASAVGGLPELVTDGDNGYLFVRGDVPALAAKLGPVLVDAGLAALLGARGRQRLRTLGNRGVHANQLQQTYTSVPP
ncbi:MAG: glycosyltransferase family 4 protein [Gammaproteobacteria bacterium]|nr:glycosyltransferase family 4 protein [Gammaproteobacteria bacterium]MYE82523.1 glycosyltransferase family 4 protein [Gammaproteobacteria bacterium]